MLLRSDILQGIRSGTITLAFRRWRRPTVRSGGTLLTAIGQLHIASVTLIDERDISEADARHAGFPSLQALQAALNERAEGACYRIEFGDLTADPRLALREAVPAHTEIEELRKRLDAMDARTDSGPWTRTVMALIASRPGVRAEALADHLGMEKLPLKARVRRLKALGLTESLEVGYRLSPRGKAVLDT